MENPRVKTRVRDRHSSQFLRAVTHPQNVFATFFSLPVMTNKQSAVEQRAESNVCACAVARRGALCETRNEIGGKKERYLKMSLFRSDSRKCGSNGSKYTSKYFSMSHFTESGLRLDRYKKNLGIFQTKFLCG